MVSRCSVGGAGGWGDVGAVAAQRRFTTPVERLVFAMVAHRALAPGSKLSLEDWVGGEVYIEGLPEVEVHQLYRAMDFLLEAGEEIQRVVFFSVADLYNLECDLLFLDTTTTYFEIEGEDADVLEGDGEVVVEEGLRKRGYSKDGRRDAAQVVIGWAVTRGGIPVRCWVWPGNYGDQNLVAEVKRDLNGWRLGRIITVLDAGFNSEENRRGLPGAPTSSGRSCARGAKGSPWRPCSVPGGTRRSGGPLRSRK